MKCDIFHYRWKISFRVGSSVFWTCVVKAQFHLGQYYTSMNAFWVIFSVWCKLFLFGFFSGKLATLGLGLVHFPRASNNLWRLHTCHMCYTLHNPRQYIESNSYKAIYYHSHLHFLWTLSDNFSQKSCILIRLVPLTTVNEPVTSLFVNTLDFPYFARSADSILA